jgi:hypothetical protein
MPIDDVLQVLWRHGRVQSLGPLTHGMPHGNMPLIFWKQPL